MPLSRAPLSTTIGIGISSATNVRTTLLSVTCKAKGSPKSKGKRVKVEEGINSNLGFGAKIKEPTWKCVKNCGACCKLDKGPAFASPDEIFTDPSDVELYKSMVGEDGWCKNYDKSTRTCSIYADRPYFCRVEPDIFETLYGISHKKFNKEACSCCNDTIKAIYGPNSEELKRFHKEIRS